SDHSADEIISNSDIVLSRTSSVLQEAVAAGVLSVACLLTEFDKNVDVQFLKALMAHDLAVSEAERLAPILSNLDGYFLAFKKARESMGLDKGIKELAEHLQIIAESSYQDITVE